MSGNTFSKITALGIGSAGTRIVSALSRVTTLVDNFGYVSCDASDLEMAGQGQKIQIEGPIDQKLTPPMVRGLAIPYRDELRNLIADSSVVFIVAGLGRATGSGLAPVVAELAKESGVDAVSVAVMPFEFEEKLRFYSGLALRRLRSVSRGVVVIDNDALLKSTSDATLKEVYELANDEAVKALSSLLVEQSDSSISVGLNKVLGTVFQDGYSFLSSASSGSFDKAEEALSRAIIGISKKAETSEANHAVVVLTGDSSVSAGETATAVKRLGSMFRSEAIDVEYCVSYKGGSQIQVSVLASGFKATKYDEYDPLSSIFRKNVIDDAMDYALVSGLERLSSCG
jgi:cell division protein FtsZ